MAFVQKRFVQAAAKHFVEQYVQHNSFVADGDDELVRHFGDEGTAGMSDPGGRMER